MGREARTERGQALVLIILGIVAIMGFAALAVDFGRIYSERRRAQNAADAAALAAALAGAHGNDWLAAGTAVIEQNGYTVSSGGAEIHWPPIAPSPYATDTLYYQVIIHTSVPPVFSQFVFKGPWEFSVEAVTRGEVSRGPTAGLGLVALGETACPGLVFHGGTNTTVRTGSIFSNSIGDGSHNCYSGQVTGTSGSIQVPNGTISTAGAWDQNAGATVDPVVTPNRGSRAFRVIDVPDCSHLPTRTVPAPGNHLLPGNYSPPAHQPHKPALDLSGGDWTLDPGMYCVHGDFNMLNGKLTGRGVMIVMYQGGIDFSGNATIYLKRPNDLIDGAGNHWGGMLIYMPMGNTYGIDIAGANNSTYIGSIYAPDIRTDGKKYTDPGDSSEKEKCSIGGTSVSTSLNSSVMCFNIGLRGNSIIDLKYQESANYRFAPRLELSQ